MRKAYCDACGDELKKIVAITIKTEKSEAQDSKDFDMCEACIKRILDILKYTEFRMARVAPQPA